MKESYASTRLELRGKCAAACNPPPTLLCPDIRITMMKELRSIFDRNEQEGYVFFDYETRVYWGEV
ncbi:hypothetical protein [Paenibacillus glucanolyticus]|uniref:hypothetical protein n=1 Tax=Paenibacillus glucanolyticus TaxID=59843 RepID=UPI00351B9531